MCRLDGPAPSGAVVAGFRQEAGFYVSGGRAVALLAVPLDTPQGRKTLQLRWDGGSLDGRLRVLRNPYPVLKVRRVPGLKKRLRASSAEKEAELLSEARGRSDGKPRWSGAFRWPLAGPVKVTSPFGARRRYNDGSLGWRHKGLDLRAAEGTPVLATADGVVLLARPALKATGGTVLLDHGYGVTSGYFHMRALEVQPGQFVHAGGRLGLSGAEGIANGPHLHFQISLRGNPVDPLQWLGPPPAAQRDGAGPAGKRP